MNDSRIAASSLRLMTAQDEERRRIARDLHDGLGQDLAVARSCWPGYLNRVHPNRTSKHALMPATLLIMRFNRCAAYRISFIHFAGRSRSALSAALVLGGIGGAQRIETYLDVQPSSFTRLTPDLETAVFRIVQEALTNVFRHSEARKVWIGLGQQKIQPS